MNKLPVDGIREDGILWVTKGGSTPLPICPTHKQPLKVIPAPNPEMLSGGVRHSRYSTTLKCLKDNELFNLPRTYQEEIEYIQNSLNTSTFEGMKFIDLDDATMVTLAKDEIKKDESGRYWVRARLTEHPKAGRRLMVIVGDREKGAYTQIFSDSDLKRWGYDQNDLDPDEVFTTFEAKFRNGSSSTYKARKEK